MSPLQEANLDLTIMLVRMMKNNPIIREQEKVYDAVLDKIEDLMSEYRKQISAHQKGREICD